MMNNLDTNNESIVLEDLTAQNTAEIKGGPNPKSKRTVVLQSSLSAGNQNRQGDWNGDGTVSGGDFNPWG